MDRTANQVAAGRDARPRARLLHGRPGAARSRRSACRSSAARATCGSCPTSSAASRRRADYGAYDIEIIAEINHCPRLPLAEIRAQARQLAADGADVIDVGCEPDGPWAGVADVVRALRDDGHRVSIDSLDPREIEPAVAAGAELVLSVNSSNRDAARDWGCEVVVVPDDPRTLAGLDETVDELAAAGVRLRIDPVLEPIGFGFAASLGRYLEVRERYPDAEMMMGIGNLTELTDADSAAVNVVLLGFCQELGIRSVLTTQVINWARSSVRECDLARRLVYHSMRHRVLPKHLEPRLVMLRDPAVTRAVGRGAGAAGRARSRTRTTACSSPSGEVHVVSRALHLHDADPFVLFEQLRQSGPDGALPKNLDAAHAFYLGLRNVQGGDGDDARQTISAGRSRSIGAFSTRPKRGTTCARPDRTRAEAP